MGISRGQVCFELLLLHIPGIRAKAPCLPGVSSFWLVFGSALFPVAKAHVRIFCRGAQALPEWEIPTCIPRICVAAMGTSVCSGAGRTS